MTRRKVWIELAAWFVILLACASLGADRLDAVLAHGQLADWVWMTIALLATLFSVTRFSEVWRKA